MQIDFYYWGSMCPVSDEIISKLSHYGDRFGIRLHDITNNFELAKSKSIFFPFLTVVNQGNCFLEKRYYAPVSDAFLQKLSRGIMPEEAPYKIAMGRIEKNVRIQPITKSNYHLASQCTGRNGCTGCGGKLKMYRNMEIIGFMNTDGENLLGGAEYFPSLYVPYDIPRGPEKAFITCVYLSDESFDYKSDPLRALEQYLEKQYKRAVEVPFLMEIWNFS